MTLVINGDSLTKLKDIATDSVDCIVSDPPYGYSFLGKSWDNVLVSIELWRECLRVLKPGGFALIMSAPRQDVLSRMIIRLDDAGFKTDFTSLYWAYSSGMPKARAVSKMMDKQNGLEPAPEKSSTDASTRFQLHDTTYSTPEARKLAGAYAGYQPKPAVEVVIVCMKPLSEKSYTDQANANGGGVTWLDKVRVPLANGENIPTFDRGNFREGDSAFYSPTLDENGVNTNEYVGDARGRFPANLIVSDDALNDIEGTPEFSKYFDLDRWWYTTQFVIVPKPGKTEKNRGLSEFESRTWDDDRVGGKVENDKPFNRGQIKRKNIHPTIKPVKLFSYLISLVSREGDTVLDPFLGSGTCAIAAELTGREWIGIEREKQYAAIAQGRIDNFDKELKEVHTDMDRLRGKLCKTAAHENQTKLFGAD